MGPISTGMGTVINYWNVKTRDRKTEKKGEKLENTTIFFQTEQNKNNKSEEQRAVPTGPPDRGI